jgi:hypothetical protein
MGHVETTHILLNLKPRLIKESGREVTRLTTKPSLMTLSRVTVDYIIFIYVQFYFVSAHSIA